MVVPARNAPAARASSPTDLRYVRVEEFLKARSLSDNTQKAYRRELHRFLDWKDLPWNRITPRHITGYKEYLRSTLTDSSLNRTLSALKSFFDWLGRTYPDVLPLDPTKTVSLNKLPSPPARDLSDSEVTALRSALSQRSSETRLRDTAILCVLLHGLRAGEVVALNLGDYDGVRLRIRKGKDDSGGSVPLDEAARGAINAYLLYRRTGGERFSAQNPLFLSHSPIRGASPRLGYQGLYYLIRELGETAGIANLTPHRLRHTYATNLLLKGIDSLHARTLTRHKSEVSFKRYAKRALESAAERAFYQAIGEEPPVPDPH
ncbi:MAG: Tyrosine recombinase XerD (plasmid) [Chroococcopsis gigantea SAG 12.99]|jgi:integrase/recombinase XerD|nr:Tyrosine recombinase XerD [Chroococcopsis gigantea SAG 12.99]